MFLSKKLLASAAAVTIALGQPVRANGQETPAIRAAPRVSMQQLRAASQTLAADVGHLVEDVEVDLRRVPTGQHILDDTREAAEAAEHSAASLDQGVDLAHAARDFQNFDENWHHVDAQLRMVANRSLQRGVARVGQTDTALHRMLGVAAPVDVQDVLRLSESLAGSAQHVPEDAQQTIGQSPRYGQLLQAADDFAEAAEHFRDSVVQGVNGEHARRDFVAVVGTWEPLSQGVYSLSPYRFQHLQVAASRVAPIVSELAGILGVVPEPTPSPTRFRVEPRGGRGTFVPNFDSRSQAVCDPSTGQIYTPRGLSPRMIAPEGDGFGGYPADESVIPPSGRSSLGELRSLARSNIAKLPPADREAALAQRVCPVTGDALGEMGVPIKVRVRGRDIFVCCKGCVAKIQREPTKYLQ